MKKMMLIFVLIFAASTMGFSQDEVKTYKIRSVRTVFKRTTDPISLWVTQDSGYIYLVTKAYEARQSLNSAITDGYAVRVRANQALVTPSAPSLQLTYGDTTGHCSTALKGTIMFYTDGSCYACTGTSTISWTKIDN